MEPAQTESPDSWQRSRVFVTGATGLLGSHLTRYLVNRGAEVIVLVRDEVRRSLFYSNAEGWGLHHKVVTVRGCLQDSALVERIISDYEVDTVFHLAAQTIVGIANREPVETFKSNIAGTWNVLEACRRHMAQVRRVIIASSDKAYGDLQGAAYDETHPLQGSHPYDVSKSCADLIAQTYHRTYGLPVAITRCGNFFGAGDLNPSRLVPGTIRDVLAGRAPVIRSNGKFIRDYLFVEDGVHAYATLAQAMTQGKNGMEHAGEAFNFSYGLKLTVTDMVSRILHAMGREDLTPVIRNEASNEIPIQTLESHKAAERLHWRPQFGFDQGLRMTIDWYQSEHQHSPQ